MKGGATEAPVGMKLVPVKMTASPPVVFMLVAPETPVMVGTASARLTMTTLTGCALKAPHWSVTCTHSVYLARLSVLSKVAAGKSGQLRLVSSVTAPEAETEKSAFAGDESVPGVVVGVKGDVSDTLHDASAAAP